MKLYATTTSERASKGQGGNDYLAIKIQVGEDRETFIRMYLHENEDGTLYELINEDTDEVIHSKLKGEKKKGEVCDNCRKATIKVYPSETIPEYWVCQNCIDKN